MFAIALFFSGQAIASGPSSNRLLNYQLRLSDPTGIPVADGTKNIKLSFYTAASGGTPVATDCNTVGTPGGRKVIFTSGTGSVLIGDTAADGTHNCTDASSPNAIDPTLFDNTSLFLGISVEADGEMTPRKRIVATGYSLNADKLDNLDTSVVGGSNAFVPVTDSSGNLTLTKNVTVDTSTFFVDAANDRVGIGTVTPTEKLTVSGNAFVTGHMIMGNFFTPGVSVADVNRALHIVDTEGTTNSFATDSLLFVNPASPGLAIHGNRFQGATVAGNAVAMDRLSSVIAVTGVQGSATITNAVGIEADVNVFNTANVTNVFSLITDGGSGGTGTITNYTGLLVDDPNLTSTGTITNLYGVYIDPQTAGTATNYALFYNGASPFVVTGAGNVGIGTTSPSSLLSVGTGSTTNFGVNSSGDVIANFTTLNGSTAANGAGANSTTLILTSAANFDVGNYVQVAATACVVNPCFAKITAISVNTLTISPALSWTSGDAVTEVHIPEIGGLGLTQALANRYGRGYFIDGIVTGNGSTRFSDNLIDTTANTFNLNTLNNRPVTFGTGTVTMNGNLVVTGTVSGGGSGAFVNNGNSFGAGATLGTNDNFALNFETNNSTRLTILSGGNVGIGTTSPSAKLQVVGNQTLMNADGLSLAGVAQTNTFVALDNTATSFVNLAHYSALNSGARGTVTVSNSATAWQNNFLQMSVHGSAHSADSYLSDSTSDAGVAMVLAQGSEISKLVVGTYDAKPMALFTNNLQRLFISSAGNVGIGTTSPAGKLDVTGTSGGTNDALIQAFAGGTSSNSIVVTNANNGLTLFSAGGAASFTPGSVANDVGLVATNNTFKMHFGSRVTTRMTLDLSNGNFGIGTTSPSTIMHIVSASPTLRVENTTAAQVAQIEFKRSGSNSLFVGPTATGQTDFWSFLNEPIRIATNNVERIRVEAAGNVGIGTTPTAFFEVRKDTAGDTETRFTNADTGTSGRIISFWCQTATCNLGNYGYVAHTGSGYTDNGVFKKDQFLIQGNDTNGLLLGTGPGPMVFGTDLGTSTSNERMRILANGNVGIGGNSSPAYLLEVRKDQNASTYVSVANATNSITAIAGIYVNNATKGFSIQYRPSASTTFADSGLLRTDSTVSGGLHIWSASSAGTAVLTLGTSDTERLRIDASGNVGIGDTTPASLLTVGSGDRFNVNTSGDVTSTFTTLDGSTTANGAGANSTTLILTSVTNFDVGNYVQVVATACVVNPCFAKITAISVNTLTISPALSWTSGDAVTEVHVPEIGGLDLTQALTNRYGRGYFIDGIVTGNGSTFFSDNKIESTGTLSINATSGQPVTFGNAPVTIGGSQSVSGNITAAGISVGVAATAGRIEANNTLRASRNGAPSVYAELFGGDANSDPYVNGVGFGSYRLKSGGNDVATLFTEGSVFFANQVGSPFGGVGRYENYLTFSEQFDNAFWTKTGVAVTAPNTNAVAAPDGQFTADTVTNTGGLSTDNIKQTSGTGTGGAATWTASVWMKTSSGTALVTLRIDNGGSPGTGVPATATTSWQRFSLTQAFGSANTPTFLIITGTNTVLLWGAQLEQQNTMGVYARADATAMTTTGRGLVTDGSLLVVGGARLGPEASNIIRVSQTGSPTVGADLRALNYRFFDSGATTSTVPARIYAQDGNSLNLSAPTQVVINAPTLDVSGQSTTIYGGANSITLQNTTQTILIKDGASNNGDAGALFTLTTQGAAAGTRYGQRINFSPGATVSGITEKALGIIVTDNTATSGTLYGLDVDVSGGTNVNKSRYAAVFNGGNVGIGTATPLTRLDVVGNVRTTGKATAVLTGSIDPAASTTVTGVGTLFSAQLVIGDRITVSGEMRTVTAIASDTSLTVDTAFSDNANDTSPDVLYALHTAKDSSGSLKLVVNDQGSVGVGVTAPLATLHSQSSGVAARFQRTSSGNIIEAFDANPTLRFSVSNLGLVSARHLKADTNGGDAAATLELRNASPVVSSSVGTINFTSPVNGEKTYARIDSIVTNISNPIQAGDLAFSTQIGGALSERMRIKDGGNVGIGTASPTANINPSSAKVLDITSIGVTDIVLHGSGTAQESSLATDGAGMYFDLAGHAAGTSNNFFFRNTSGNSSYGVTERMRIDAGGNVGIGTSGVPATKLQLGSGQLSVPAGSVGTPSYVFTGDTSSGFYSVATGTISYSSQGTTVWLGSALTGQSPITKSLRLSSVTGIGWSTSPDTIADDLVIARDSANTLQIGFSGASPSTQTFKSADGTGTNIAGAALQIAGGKGTGNASGGDILFQTSNALGSGNTLQSLTTKLSIKASGKVGIGTTSPITQLHVPVTVPTAQAGTYTSPTTQPFTVYVQGRYAYLSEQGSGSNDTLRVVDVSDPASPASIGSVGTGGNTTPQGLRVQGRYAYMVNFTTATLQVFDVSNPASPSLLSTTSTNSGPAAIHVAGRYAYIANFGAGNIQVFDISNPAAPVAVGSATAGSQANWIFVQGRYAYVTNSSANTFQVFDVSNPASPTSVGSVATGASTQPWSTYVQGRYAYVVNKGTAQLQIIDVSNPASPTLVSGGVISIGSSPRSVWVQGRYAFTANLSSDTISVVDISNPASPSIAGSISTNSQPIDVNVSGRYLYVVNYSGNTLQTFDLGGAYIQQLETGSAETGSLNVRESLQAMDGAFGGGLTVGSHLNVSGRLSVQSETALLGNVGIGQTSPLSKLHLKDGGYRLGLLMERGGSTANRGFLYIGDGTNSTSTDEIYFDNVNSAFHFRTGVSGTTENFSITVGGAVKVQLASNSSNALCHPTNGAGFDEITDCSGTPAADYAEIYSTAADVVSGDIVALGETTVTTKDGEDLQQFVKATVPYGRGVLGVVSDPTKATDFNVIGYNIKDADHPMPIALNGRVSATVSNENGPILPGDPITASATVPGAGMKATESGMIVGFALSSHDQAEPGKLLVFVNPGWWNGAELADSNSSSGVTKLSELTIDADKDMMGFGLMNVGPLHGVADLWSIDASGKVTAKEISVDMVTVRKTDAKKTIGEGLIPSGESYAQLHDASIKAGSKVFLTFRKNPRSFWWIDEVSDGFFVVKTDAPVMEETVFDYWVVGVIDETTPPPEPASQPETAPVPEPAPEPVPE